MTRQIIKKDPDFSPTEHMGFDRLLVISLGTGSNKREKKYSAKMASKWGAISWVYDGGNTPLIDCYSDASKDMVDFHNSVVFQAFNSENNYLRIDVSHQYYLCVFFPPGQKCIALSPEKSNHRVMYFLLVKAEHGMILYSIEKSFYVLYILKLSCFFAVFKG